MSITDPTERARARSEVYADYYSRALERSAAFRQEYVERLNVVKWHDMPLENSPDGLIKHVVNGEMNTKECCVDIYMQFIPPGGATGKSRHLSEEVAFVAEGNGYDLHWDVRFDCKDEFEWSWEEEPKKFEWSVGDFLYIPPYCAHKRFNSDPQNEARVIVANSRIIQAMGFDWFEQIENAEGYGR